MRLISICPSNTEIAAYLGLTKQLVGVDRESDWPKAVARLPRLGPDLSIDMDRLESLAPDLVLASLSVPGMEKNVAQLQKRNIPHLVLRGETLADIERDVIMVGEATGKEIRAREIIRQFRAFFAYYRSLSQHVVNRPGLYWEWWPKPIFTPGKKNWLTEISRLAGAYNVFADKESASVQTDWNTVLQRKPDYICMVWVGVEPQKVKKTFVTSRTGSEQCPAVVKGRIHILEEPLFCRPSPRLALGLKRIASLIHPDVFPAYDGKDPLCTLNTSGM